MTYQIIISLFIFISVVWGFRRGFARQVPALLGVAFGAISARLLAPGLYVTIKELFSGASVSAFPEYYCSSFAHAFIFIGVYLVFTVITGFLGKVLDSKDRTIMNNIGGAIFSLFETLLFISVLFNCIAACNEDSGLVRSARSDDGNAVELVMMISPALMGGPDIEDFALVLQLRDAKKIS